MPAIDLHCHSNVSDGLLPPAAVVDLAANRGCQWFALTDHDDVRGLAEARQRAGERGMGFINGVEISVTWRKHTLHVVGLDFDPEHPVLQAGLQEVRRGRHVRAQAMSDSLARAGIADALAGASRHAANPEILSRTHFARHLVAIGAAKDVHAVFKRFLKPGKPGFVSHTWAALGDAVAWITAAGGVAVLAHPARYDMGQTQMLELLSEFKAAGGRALEVVTANHDANQVSRFAALAQQLGLAASCGSDFHGAGETWCEPGVLPDLPYNCAPVWLELASYSAQGG